MGEFIMQKKIYTALTTENKKLFAFQGGARAGKTYNIAMWLICYAYSNNNKVVSVVRLSRPSLMKSVFRDFLEIITKMNLPCTYKAIGNCFKFKNGSIIEFFSVDDEQKVRGSKRDILFVNEANELSKDKFFQLSLRTTGIRIIDFNPSFSRLHWINEELSKEDTLLTITTYKDNEFLERNVVEYIEKLKTTNPRLYKIYGEGLPAPLEGACYSNYTILEDWERDDLDVLYGVDFGFATDGDPTAVIECRIDYKLNNIYLRERLYARGLKTAQLAKKLREIDTDGFFICDNALPATIADLRLSGVVAVACKKWKREERVNYCAGFNLVIDKKSLNLQNEIYTYRWKEDGKPTDGDDHLLDAMGYAVTYFKKNTKI